MTAAQAHRPGDCPGCGAEYPHCDCAEDEGDAESREGWYAAMEILDA
jgi:hypothetical protein